MSKEITRRQFLGGVGCLCAAFLAGCDHAADPVLGVKFDHDPQLSWAELTALAKRLDRVSDSLPDNEPEPTAENLRNLVNELVPQFEYEKIVEKAGWPAQAEFVFFRDGQSANHVMGRSDCSTYAILNGRLGLNLSSFYGRGWVFTLAHELAHVAQGPLVCWSQPRNLVENSAQIAALEVTAGLANQGSRLMFAATVRELRDMALAAALFKAREENRMAEFDQFRAQLSPGAFARARFEKSKRRWADDPNKWTQILSWYNYEPWQLLANSLRGDARLAGLALPPQNNQPRTIQIDDLKYLLENLEKLAREVK